ncbi:carboxymuconolactone decarboxylase family protein [Nocardioides mangrovi]|uniref:Carboxymuconolactone decarboxylase family protein n=1 Tax=Nocardioides mangrovi TaxID=2874580 RepID=A0ABS7UEW9_9ACTN|nr:carboxymuconolactone decarboxylase family protein [Nocardioides mangrovi]MBZ5739553.1 carboxymuconolactone decarboxylase family protein [Nocardioides mangrovi]
MSGPRVRALRPSELTADQAAVYASIAGGPRASGPKLFELTDPDGRLNGPFNAMLLSPTVGDALQALGAAVRYGTSLSDRVREMAILAVATSWDSEFERYAHEAVGRAAGLSEEEIVALRDLPALTPTDVREAAALDVVRALLERSDLDDAEWDAANAVLGQDEIFELTALVGYYATLALLMRTHRVPAPPASGAGGGAGGIGGSGAE